jgi:hypothetical protein
MIESGIPVSAPETQPKKASVSGPKVGSGLKKFIVFFSLSDVVANLSSAAEKIPEKDLQKFGSRPDRMPGYYSYVDPIEGAVRQLHELSKYTKIDWHIVSSISWTNPNALLDKRKWLDDHFGPLVKNRLIFVKRKDLLRGDYLVYRHETNGVKQFAGKQLRFGEDPIPHWSHIVHYFGFIAEHGPLGED